MKLTGNHEVMSEGHLMVMCYYPIHEESFVDRSLNSVSMRYNYNQTHLLFFAGGRQLTLNGLDVYLFKFRTGIMFC